MSCRKLKRHQCTLLQSQVHWQNFNPMRTRFIGIEIADGAFVSPNGIMQNSKRPCGVINAVFFLESSLIRICQ